MRDENAIPQPDGNAQVVVEALTCYADGGRSYGAVARHLNAHPSEYRWRNRRGEAVLFDKYDVRSIVSNVLIYAGWVPVGRGKDMRITDRAKTVRELVRLTDAAPSQHSALVDEELANRVLAARHARLELRVRREAHVYLLTPVLHCANCGEALRGNRWYRGTGDRRYAHRDNAQACIADADLNPFKVDGSHYADLLEERARRVLTLELPQLPWMTCAASSLSALQHGRRTLCFSSRSMRMRGGRTVCGICICLRTIPGTST
jgi:hypothetical protein